jgi:hypothetical protein
MCIFFRCEWPGVDKPQVLAGHVPDQGLERPGGADHVRRGRQAGARRGVQTVLRGRVQRGAGGALVVGGARSGRSRRRRGPADALIARPKNFCLLCCDFDERARFHQWNNILVGNVKLRYSVFSCHESDRDSSKSRTDI